MLDYRASATQRGVTKVLAEFDEQIMAAGASTNLLGVLPTLQSQPTLS
jgi:hypothetical protein